MWFRPPADCALCNSLKGPTRLLPHTVDTPAGTHPLTPRDTRTLWWTQA